MLKVERSHHQGDTIDLSRSQCTVFPLGKAGKPALDSTSLQNEEQKIKAALEKVYEDHPVGGRTRSRGRLIESKSYGHFTVLEEPFCVLWAKGPLLICS